MNDITDIFVSINFEESFNGIYEVIKKAADKVGLMTFRVDERRTAVNVSTEISVRIRNCRVFIADLTGNRPNILNEIGQAQAYGKPMILISQDKSDDAPFNVRGMQINLYDKANLNSLQTILEKALADTTSPNELLRQMLVPSSLGRPTGDSKFVIVASPLSYRRASGRTGGHKKFLRTQSDYVGIRGILQAFGLLYDFDAMPDILDPEDFNEDVIKEKLNIYTIGSPKANSWTGRLLAEFSSKWKPKIEFKADIASKNLRNVAVSLYENNAPVLPTDFSLDDTDQRTYRDFGVIIRGPNPFDSDYMITILAGRSSLGTEAASLAFTSPHMIKEINRRLVGNSVNIEDHKQPFLALVSLEKDRETLERKLTTLKVENRVHGFTSS